MEGYNIENDQPQFRDLINIFEDSGHSVGDIDINDVAPANLGLDVAYRSIDVYHHHQQQHDLLSESSDFHFSNHSPKSINNFKSNSSSFILIPTIKKVFNDDDLLLDDDSLLLDETELLEESDLLGGYVDLLLPKQCTSFPTCPSKPRYLLANNFITMLSLACVINTMTDILRETADVCVQYLEHQYKWKVFFLKGLVNCKIELCVYQAVTGGWGGFYVEANRLSGCSRYFRTFYSDLEKTFSSVGSKGKGSEIEEGAPPVQIPQLEPLTDAKLVQQLKPVLAMLRSPKTDLQAEACQMMCLLAPQEELHAAMVDSGVVHALVECLVASPSSAGSTRASAAGHKERRAVEQHAILAVACLSDCTLTRECLLASPSSAQLLCRLMDLCYNGPYDTAEMSRESARALKNVCKNNSKQIRSTVDIHKGSAGGSSSMIADWAAGLDALQDPRLKMQATEAAKSLLAVVC